MTRNFQSQKGFAAIQALLVLVIVIMVGGVGYYVWQSQKQVDKTYSQTANSSAAPSKNKIIAPSAKTDPNAGYFVIKEWNVRSAYSATYHLSYKINNLGGSPAIYSASFTSTELPNYLGACNAGGGIIEQANADSVLDKAGTTPTSKNSPYTTTKVGNYYYVYIPPQGYCSDNTTLQKQVDDVVKAVVTNLQATP
jgi:hypothetical protein